MTVDEFIKTIRSFETLHPLPDEITMAEIRIIYQGLAKKMFSELTPEDQKEIKIKYPLLEVWGAKIF